MEKTPDQFVADALNLWLDKIKKDPAMDGATVGRLSLSVNAEIITKEGFLRRVEAPLVVLEGFGTESPKAYYLFS